MDHLAQAWEPVSDPVQALTTFRLEDRRDQAFLLAIASQRMAPGEIETWLHETVNAVADLIQVEYLTEISWEP